jgi:putative ABC transport system substrate-binding protein
MISRRDLVRGLAGAALVGAPAARAQVAGTAKIGFLSGRSLTSDAHLVAAFAQGLGEAGYAEGRNLEIAYRWADGQLDRLPGLAADLVGRAVSVIFAGGIDVRIGELKAAITQVPAVFATGGDPVELGLAQSLNRPGGNITYVTVISAALWPKRVELLRNLVGPAARLALLVNPSNVTAEPSIRGVRAVVPDALFVSAKTFGDIEVAFATLAREQAGGLMVANDALFIGRRDLIAALAARHGIPTLFDRREFVAVGGLLSYGASVADQYRQSGLYVGRILKGARPGDMPVLQPTKFETVVNLRSAKALGLTVPLAVLERADEVIE